MKNIVLITIVMATISFTACSNEVEKKSKSTVSENTKKAAQFSCPMHPEVKGLKGEMCSKCGMELTEPVVEKDATLVNDAHNEHEDVGASGQSDFSTNSIITNYLTMKNALTEDDSKGVAKAGKELYKIFQSIKNKDKKYLEIADDAKEHAEHIGDNENNIEHQREHFVLLSKDINDLVKIYGSEQKLYQDFCPMANDNKGAIWISEFREIKNPYLGSKMRTCGSIKKEF